MNAYGSVLNHSVGWDICEKTISPPSNLEISSTDWKRVFLRGPHRHNTSPLDPESNFIVRGVGLFSNFADGLVFQTGGNRPVAALDISYYSIDSTLTGLVAFTKGSKAVVGTGTAFDTELSAGDYIRHTDREIFIVDSVTDAENLVLTQYARSSGGSSNVKKMSKATGFIQYYDNILTLNEIYTGERFLPTASIYSSSADQVAIQGYIVPIDTGDTIDFLTKSIYNGFSGDTVTFQLLAEIEYTLKTS